MAQTLFQLLSGEESPTAQRKKTKEESKARREYNKQEKVQKARMHSLLDILGLAPIAGEPFDLLSAYLYGQEGNLEQAAYSGASAVPFLGAGAFVTRKGAGGMMKYFNQLKWYEQGLLRLQEVISKGKGKYDHIKEHVDKLYGKLNRYLGTEELAPTQARIGFKQQQKGAAKLRELDKGKAKQLEDEFKLLGMEGDEIAEVLGDFEKKAKSGGRVSPAPTKQELAIVKKKRVEREYIDQPVYKNIGGQMQDVSESNRIARQRAAIKHQRKGTIGEKYYDEGADIETEMTSQMRSLITRRGIEE